MATTAERALPFVDRLALLTPASAQALTDAVEAARRLVPPNLKEL